MANGKKAPHPAAHNSLCRFDTNFKSISISKHSNHFPIEPVPVSLEISAECYGMDDAWHLTFGSFGFNENIRMNKWYGQKQSQRFFTSESIFVFQQEFQDNSLFHIHSTLYSSLRSSLRKEEKNWCSCRTKDWSPWAIVLTMKKTMCYFWSYLCSLRLSLVLSSFFPVLIMSSQLIERCQCERVFPSVKKEFHVHLTFLSPSFYRIDISTWNCVDNVHTHKNCAKKHI